MFSEFGNVVSVKLFAENGYGFVSFDIAASAQNALQAINGMLSPDGTKRLEVTLKKEGSSKSTTKNNSSGSNRYTPY